MESDLLSSFPGDAKVAGLRGRDIEKDTNERNGGQGKPTQIALFLACKNSVKMCFS